MARGIFRHPPQPQQQARYFPLPDVAIIPTAVQSGQFVPAPSVVGNQAIIPNDVPTGENVPTPFINLEQVLVPAAVPSGQNIPAPFVSLTQDIVPSAVPSGQSVPAPQVRGNTLFINVFGVASGVNIPTPTVEGGNTSLRIYIGGTDVTLLTNGLNGGLSPMGAAGNSQASQITSQAIGRATMTFDMVDTAGVLVGVSGLFSNAQAMCGLTVRVTELGATLFAGCIDTVGVDREMPFDSNTIIVYHITALDKTSICDHRMVTSPTYATGEDVVAVILDIVANYLNGEGITTQGVPAAGSLGTLDSDLTTNYTSVRNVFDSIATQSGTVWWIDQYGVLFFSTLSNLPAGAFAITETANIRNSKGTAMVQASLSGGSATSGYRNKEYVVSNLNVLPTSGSSGGSGPATVTETFTFANGQPGVISQILGGVLTPVAVSVSLPIGSITAMTVNGNAQTTVEFGQFDGQTPSGPTDYLWFWTQGGTELSWTDGPVPGSSAISVSYIPGNSQGTVQSSVVVGSAISPTAPSGAKLGTCGSGIFEVADQVKNISSITDLNALAQDFLDRSGAIPIILTFETDQPGLQVGQLLSVALPSSGLGTAMLPASLVVSQMTGTAQTGPLAFGSWFRWTVTAINNYDASNWLTYFSRFIQRTENPLPVLQYEPAKFILGSGSSLSTGNNITNPYPVQRTGLVTLITIVASVPPVQQNLVVTINRNGSQIAQIVMPAGTATNQLISLPVPQVNQLYLFAGDILTVSASYQQTGHSPVQASGVTVSVYWAM